MTHTTGDAEEGPAMTGTHTWVGRAFVMFGPQARRGFLDLGGDDTRVDLLDVHCLACQRPYDASGDQPCPGRLGPRVAAHPAG